MGLEAEIWALSLGSESERRGTEEMEKARKRKKSPISVKEKVIDPFGAAALLPINFYHNLLRQGMGTADHLTLLRILFKCHVK